MLSSAVSAFSSSPPSSSSSSSSSSAAHSTTRKKILELVEREKTRGAADNSKTDKAAGGGGAGRSDYVLDVTKHSLNAKEVEILMEVLIAQETEARASSSSSLTQQWQSSSSSKSSTSSSRAHATSSSSSSSSPPCVVGVLRMDGYRIGDAGAAAVANWLAGPTCRAVEVSLAAGDVTAKALEFVEAERKDVGEKGGAALGKALLTNASLQVLDLRSNSLSSVTAGRSSAAMLAFARALHVNSTLTTLDLSGNMLSHSDVTLLADALRRNHSLTRLNLAKTRTSKEALQFMAECVMQNNTLMYLDLRGKAVTSYHSIVQSWVDCLQVNWTLIEVQLPNSALRDDSAKLAKLSALLQRNINSSRAKKEITRGQISSAAGGGGNGRQSDLSVSAAPPSTPREASLTHAKLSRSTDAPEDRARDGIKRESGGKGRSGADSPVRSASKTVYPPDVLAEEQERRRISLVRYIIQNDSKRRVVLGGFKLSKLSNECLEVILNETGNGDNPEPQQYSNSVVHPFAKFNTARDDKREKRGDKSTAKELETAKELRALATGTNENTETFMAIHCTSSDDPGGHSERPLVPRESAGVVELYLHNNRLENLPEAIGRFKRLRALDLCGNRLVALPNQLMFLTRLQLLDCSHNALSSLPFIQPICTMLTRLYLNHNKFTEFPFEVTDLVNLRKLDLSFNRIAHVPVEIGNLQHLKYFWAQNNRITTIPRSIVNLQSSLVELHLDSNRLDFLPTEVAELKRLSVLGLEGNPLRTFPRDVQQLAHAGVVRKVQEYLNELEGGSRSFNRVKLMFVGDGGVGKSSLLGCFNRERVEEDNDGADESEATDSGKKDKKKAKKKSKKNEPNIATDGIDIATAKWNNISFRAWDFAGQDLYHTTHQFFLSKRSIYLLVFNLLHMLQNKSDATATVDYWLHSLQARVPGVPVVIVGTHLDLYTKATKKKKKKDDNESTAVDELLSKIRSRYKRRFPNVMDVMAVSTKTKRGVKELQARIADIAEKKKYVGQQVPTPYVILARQVDILTKKKSPPIMTLSEFEEVARAYNVAKEEVVDVLHFLHTIGEVAYFDDDPSDGLADRVFLDPQWLTNVMSSVVTLRHNIVREGKLRHCDLSFIWKPPQFPPSVHPTLIQLLKKFEILYPLPRPGAGSVEVKLGVDSADNKSARPSLQQWKGKQNEIETEVSLVPCLLDKERPESKKSEWPLYEDELEQISRVWEFQFLPLGFFSRLFVRTMNVVERYSKNTDKEQGGLEVVTYWTNGIIVRLGESRGEKSEKGFMEYIPDEFVLKLHVRTKSDSSKLFALLVENVDSLIEGWFQNQIKSVHVLCPHCIKAHRHPPTTFSLKEIQLAVTQGRQHMPCHGALLDIHKFAADVALVNMTEWIVSGESLKIEECVGAGAFAQVYRAHLHGQEVAAKKINLVEAGASQGDISEKFQDLRREVMLMRHVARRHHHHHPTPKAWVFSPPLANDQHVDRLHARTYSGLKHPNTVRLKGICLSPLMIITEFLSEGNLYEFLKARADQGKQIGWPLRLRIARDIAEGMKFLHSATPPIIHRDLKSPNVLLASASPNSVVVAKVADFGLSTRMTAMTVKGRNVWNPVWLAPEIMRKKEYTEKADVYGYGIMLWEILTLKHPFDEYRAKYEADSQLEEAIVNGLRPSTPADLVESLQAQDYLDLLSACWDPDPQLRPTFERVCDKLTNIQTQLAPDTLAAYGGQRSRGTHESDSSSTELPVVEQAKSTDFTTANIAKLEKDRGVGITCLLLVESEDDGDDYDKSIMLWAGCQDGAVCIWNARSGDFVTSAPGHKGPVTNLVVTEAGVWSSSPKDSQILLWDRKKHRVSKKIKTSGGVNGMLFVAPFHVWSTSQNTVTLWDAKTGKSYKSFEVGAKGELGTMACIKSNVWIAAASSIVVCQPTTLTTLDTITSHTATINAIVRVGQEVWSCGNDRKIVTYNLEGEVLQSIDNSDRVLALAYQPSCMRVWSASADGLVAVWDARTYQTLQRLEGHHKATTTGQKAEVAALARYADSESETLYSAASDGSVVAYRLGECAIAAH